MMSVAYALWPQFGGGIPLPLHRAAQWAGGSLLGGGAVWGALTWVPPRTDRDWCEHIQIVGGTGSGKTNALHHLMLEGAHRGYSLVSFHQTVDDADQLAAILTSRSAIPLMRFDPLQADCPPLNLLECPPEPLHWDRVAQTVRAIFEDQGPQGHVMAQVLEMATYALLEAFAPKSPTLRHLIQFLVTEELRAKVLPRVRNPVVRLYWDQVFEAQARSAIRDAAAILNVLRSPPLLTMLDQPHGVDVAALLADPICLQVVADRDRLGPAASAVYGRLWVSLLEQITYRRPPTHRVTLIGADEWPLYRTRSLERCLEQGRRHRVGWILTSQHTGQAAATQQAAWQTGTQYIFRPESLEDAPKLARMLGLERADMNLPRRTCWAREMRRGVLRPPRRIRWPYLLPKGGHPHGPTHAARSSDSGGAPTSAVPDRRAN